MKAYRTLTLIVGAALLVGCAATPPKELVNARAAFDQAKASATAHVAPAELHVASLALAKAEQSFKRDPDSYVTRDLAYVAQRKTQIAVATASISIKEGKKEKANSEYQKTQGNIIAKTKSDLSDSNSALAAAEYSEEMTAQQLADEKKARAVTDRRLAEAMAALAELAAVKEEPRGLVITLSGSVLFASNRSTLLPAAQARLDQVVAVLLATRERHLTVEGHTDSKGTEANNMDLSQRRANAVRNYLVKKQYGADLIQANGMGEGSPVADNSNPEGRANNRRVEIIIANETQASNR